jgi:hypothetical protein
MAQCCLTESSMRLTRQNPSLFDSPVLSDLRIISRHRTYHAHKAIVCPRSDVFKNESGEQDSEVSNHHMLAFG